MKWNWRPERPAFIDFEVQSQCPLETANKYATHPSTRALTCCVRVGGRTLRFGPYLDAEAKDKLTAIAREHTLVAHNAPFDGAIWEKTEGLPEVEWCDTLPLARQAGLPGKLDDLGTRLTGRGKDPTGKKLIDLLCILKPGQRPPVVGPAHAVLMQYNARDAELLEEIYEHVRDPAYSGEDQVMTLDAIVNERGIPVDRDYVQKLKDIYEENAAIVGKEFAERTGGVNPTSPKQVKEWMNQLGFTMPKFKGKESLQKFALKELMAAPEKFFIGDVPDDAEDMQQMVGALLDMLEMRKELVRVGKGKADAALAALEADGRIRGQFVYWGAHTGRWAGRGLQLHNMPRGVEVDPREIPAEYGAVKAAAEKAGERMKRRVYVADVLNAMLRTMVRGFPMLVADYGAVEARGIAWVADETRMLELFKDPEKSVYIDMGTQVFGRPITKKGDLEEYNMAKTLVLGCGYGMSGAKFEFTCKNRGISVATFAKAGLDTKEAVRVYRETYPAIPRVWKAYGDAALQCVEHHWKVPAGKCLFYMRGDDLHMELPSGRCIVYRNARIEMQVPAWQKLYGVAETPVQTVCYDSPRGWRNSLYGSKIAENAVQGLCRDFLADALVKSYDANLDPFLHVHDELACAEEDKYLEQFMEIMSTPPGWAPDFPVLAEGYAGPMWSKVSKGYRECNALNGRVL